MDPTYTAEYELFETKHWWHVARLGLIHWELDRHVARPERTRWLDVGCGTGVLLDSYPKVGERMGLELDAGSVARARSKGLDVRQVSPRWDLSTFGTFDLVTMCDVVEHVEDDRAAIAAVRAVLNPDGVVLVTVPALRSLWSAHDVRNHHYRRYDRASLLALFDPAEWDVRHVTYFSSLLLPMIWAMRQVKNRRYGTDPATAPPDKKFGPPWVDALLLGVFRLECQCLKMVNMPIGSSLILVARRGSGPGFGGRSTMSASDATGPSGVHEKEARFHDEWAQSTPLDQIHVREAFEAGTAVENQFILSRMGDLRGKRLLDVGAGLGESSVYFALRGAEVTCTDLSPGMVEAAQNLARHHGVSIRGQVVAGESLEVEADHYDFVYIANTIHHVTDRRQLFAQVRRALKPGGSFFSWDPMAYNPVINVYRRLATEVRTEDEAPLTFNDVALAREYFTDVGHREFWIASLSLFLKYYAIDRVHPNADRYWKRIYTETDRSLWWWKPLRAADGVLTRLPLVRRLAWNMVMWGRKAQ